MLKMNFLGKQLQAARAFTGWSQAELSRRVGITQATISEYESGKSKNPNARYLERIKTVFAREGVVLSEDGVYQKDESTYVIGPGEDWWLEVLDDVYETLIDKPNAECIFVCADDRESSPEVVRRYRKLRNAGIRFRQFVREGNTYLMGPVAEYRYVPKERFLNNVTLIYGDKIAVCAGDNTRALVIKDAATSRSQRNLIEILWDTLEQPTESLADERF